MSQANAAAGLRRYFSEKESEILGRLPAGWFEQGRGERHRSIVKQMEKLLAKLQLEKTHQANEFQTFLVESPPPTAHYTAIPVNPCKFAWSCQDRVPPQFEIHNPPSKTFTVSSPCTPRGQRDKRDLESDVVDLVTPSPPAPKKTCPEEPSSMSCDLELERLIVGHAENATPLRTSILQVFIPHALYRY